MIHRLPCEILVMMVKKLMHGKKSEHTHQELRYPKGEGGWCLGGSLVVLF